MREMLNIVRVALLSILLMGTVTVSAQTVELEPMENGPLRLSAIVSAGTRYYAGFVDAESGAAYLVPEGGSVLNWKVKSIDEGRMSALLVDRDGDEMLLVLTGDENAVTAEGTDSTLPRAKTLAEFLAEHPELAAAHDGQGASSLSATTNSVVTFEDFIAAHPDLAGVSNYIAPGLRDPDTGAVATLTEADVDTTPISREEGLKRMAEQMGKPMPEIKETTYEEFIRMNTPTPPAAP